MIINREKIIDSIKAELENDNRIFAFWLEGADAHGKADKYSDIDMWLDVDDGYEDTVVNKITAVLDSISPLDFIYEHTHFHPKIRQFFLHMQSASPYLFIDMCLQSHSRKIAFIKENADEKVKVIFDKTGVIKYTNIDIDSFEEQNDNRKEEIKNTFDFFTILVLKEIRRNNYLEALNYYNERILNPIIEYLRIVYAPTKKDFGLKHIKSDLPVKDVEVLEYLHKIASLNDLEEKTKQAIEFFYVISK